MQYRPLGTTGLSVSVIGFGASPLGGVFGPADRHEGEQAVHYAIDQGINFFDVSPYYGATLAEERLGHALLGHRHRVILATKCGRYGPADFDFSRPRLLRSIDESLSRLKTDYVDLLQAHDVEFADVGQIENETIPALQQIQQSGKARCIGISGYPLRLLRDLIARNHIQTVLSYCRYNLLVHDLDQHLTPVAASRQVAIINASPLHMGLLGGGAIPGWHPASASTRQIAEQVSLRCRRRGLDPGAVALNYCLRHPVVASTLVGMRTPAEVEANLDALSIAIDPQLWRDIEQLVAPVENELWPSGRPENQDSAG